MVGILFVKGLPGDFNVVNEVVWSVHDLGHGLGCLVEQVVPNGEIGTDGAEQDDKTNQIALQLIMKRVLAKLLLLLLCGLSLLALSFLLHLFLSKYN